MPRKKQSSDEYEPEHLSDEDVKGSSDGGSTPNEPEIPPDFLTERKAKVNRKEIVESEDSDKLSSVSEKSDDYDPGGAYGTKKKKQGRVIQRHKDSDSEDDMPAMTPSPAKPVRRPRPKQRKKQRKWMSSESSASTTSESDEQGADDVTAAKNTNKSPIDLLQDKFPRIPRTDITRVYYQMSCQVDRTENFLKMEWHPGKFQKPNAAKAGSDGAKSGSEESASSESEKSNLASDKEADAPGEPEPEEAGEEFPGKKKKRKTLNSSDEEWCPLPKKQKIRKRVIKPISSSEDEPEEAQQDGGTMSDAGDEDFSGAEEVKRSKDAETKIFKFLANATEAELMTVQGLSEKKCAEIISARPFKSFAHMRTLFHTTIKKIGNFDNVASATEELLKGRDLVKTLLKRCEKMAGTLGKLLKTNDGGLAMETPECMSKDLTLKPYQKRGLHWLTLVHSQKIGAILADEMGLGKTVQTIAFLAWLKTVSPNFTRPHLVVCPSSTLENWRREFECWCPSFRIHSYHGEHRRHVLRKIIKAKNGAKADDFKEDDQTEDKANEENASLSSYENIDVIITTYQSCVANEHDRVAIKKLGVGYAIFDEGHMLKNMNTHRYQQLMKIGARRRLLLTGTPLQNNLLELMSLLKFIMPDLLQKSSATLQKIFKLRNSESDFARQRVFEAKTILQPFVLRRVKADVLKDLPPKVEETIMVDLTDQQKMFYYEIQDRVRSRLNVAQNGEDASKTQLKNEFMQLRKVANHPLLHRNHYTPDILRKMARTLCQKELAKDGNAQYIFEDFEVMSDFQIHQTCEKYKSLKKFKLKKDAIFNSGKFKTLDTLLPQLLEEDHRVVLFSQFVIMMDILERYFLARNIKYLRLDGSTPVDQRLELIDEFNADYDINVFMISTKAGGLGINLTSADTVIIHDIDSNPFNDKQAEDRCHRVGQTKEVKIIRLITKDTIEIKMRKMALEKLKLEDKMGMEDKMLYKRRSMETGEPVLEPDDDSNDGPNDDELVNLLRADSPTNVIANGTSKIKTETLSGSDVKTEARAESDIKIEAENGTEKEPLKELSPNQTPQLVHNEVKMETD